MKKHSEKKYSKREYTIYKMSFRVFDIRYYRYKYIPNFIIGLDKSMFNIFDLCGIPHPFRLNLKPLNQVMNREPINNPIPGRCY